MVGFDSIIPPGRVGKVTQKVDIRNMAGGPFSKGVTVTSNATNTPTIRLSLKGTIRAYIDVSPQYVGLSKNTPSEVVTLRTEKKDLQITKLVFETVRRNTGAWQEQLPMFVPYTLTKADKVDATGYYEYKLKLTNKTDATQRMDGKFVLTTNHPNKKELHINGWIDADTP